MAPSLNELDARLRALREQLGSSSGSSSDDGEGSDTSLEPIPALPHHLLPEYYTREATHQRGEAVPPEPPPLRRPARAAEGEEEAPRKKKAKRSAPAASDDEPTAEEAAAGGDRPVCVTCGLRFTSAAQLEEHTRGKKHRQNERAQRLGPAVAQGRPPEHRPPPVELEGPACGLCRKAFTSEAQLQEHIRGKWHQMRLHR